MSASAAYSSPTTQVRIECVHQAFVQDLIQEERHRNQAEATARTIVHGDPADRDTKYGGTRQRTREQLMGAEAVTHRMIGGSHERPTGPECRCGADWDWWNDVCTSRSNTES